MLSLSPFPSLPPCLSRQRDPSIVRVLDFVSKCVTFRQEGREESDDSGSLLDSFLGALLPFGSSPERAVRYRVCHLLDLIFHYFDEDTEVGPSGESSGGTW